MTTGKGKVQIKDTRYSIKQRKIISNLGRQLFRYRKHLECQEDKIKIDSPSHITVKILSIQNKARIMKPVREERNVRSNINISS